MALDMPGFRTVWYLNTTNDETSVSEKNKRNQVRGFCSGTRIFLIFSYISAIAFLNLCTYAKLLFFRKAEIRKIRRISLLFSDSVSSFVVSEQPRVVLSAVLRKGSTIEQHRQNNAPLQACTVPDMFAVTFALAVGLLASGSASAETGEKFCGAGGWRDRRLFLRLCQPKRRWNWCWRRCSSSRR